MARAMGCRRRPQAAPVLVAGAILAAVAGRPASLFSALPRRSPLGDRAVLCDGARAARGHWQGQLDRQGLPAPVAAGALAAQLGWIDPRRWGAPPSPADRLSPREWIRQYRILGISEDASKEQVLKAATRLRRKYADNEEALGRVETANLWIMTKMVARNEEDLRQRQQANRMRELGDSPRRLFQKYIAGYIPPSIRQMMEAPNTKHFRWSSGLMGAFALMALCVPNMASTFVGLGAAAALGLVYQRNRPEPVKDDFGNVGEVRKVNPKEMAATIVLIVIGCLCGTVLSLGIGYFLADTPFAVIFAVTCNFVLWLIALFFKVYQCFDLTA